ncbi:DUF1045 domain-containing protein [uncultured Tateyamaria sp.]|uniref:DUF1045 domain-containing protein n=1 Tax=uncultured Tateyamaria sp. TaxID=455651 RepID=UPI00261CACE0|nr:DUF1045 domain-containing protein [uncultured Tateyamaria sp.]
MYTRYAIYHTPEAGTPLAELGAAWLGWDSAQGSARTHPNVDGVDVAAVTATPRKYGFHGTIKPPFRLAEGCSIDEVRGALATLCADTAPVTLTGLQLAQLGRFLALVPTGDASDLGALAARVVQDLDTFRAPLSETELSKRRTRRLSPAQDAYLVRWGYPYVLDQFRFHMTLSGNLDQATAQQAEAALNQLLAPIALTPYRIAGLTLLGEDAEGMFHHIHHYALTG